MKHNTVAALLATTLLMAADARADIDISLHGVLIIPPVCTLSSTSPINVPFGDIGVRKVDGIQFKKPIPYTLSCSGDTSHDWAITMTFSGTAASFASDGATLRANSPLNGSNLGIQIIKDGAPFVLGVAVAIDPASPPVLEAVPVKRSGTDLLADTFNATGTLRVDYQ